MAIKIAINGFGRIGRTVLRRLYSQKSSNLEVVAINDIAPTSSLAHLFKYDSVHGIFPGEVSAEENNLIINGKKIPVTTYKDPSQSEWGKFGVQIVLECSGLFTSREKCSGHLKDTVKKVIVSAPAENPDITLVKGVNDSQYDSAKHNIISNASCTTNCLAPVVKVIHEKFKVKRGLMTTIHSYTNDQKILDVPHKDLRRARAAGLNIIPTSTGAAKTVGKVLGEKAGKLDGLSLRVPTPTVSIVDFVCTLKKETTKEELNDVFKANEIKGVFRVSEEPLVSMDFKGDTYSSILDAPLTMASGNLVKVVAWYDNEWAYSCRLGEFCLRVAEA